MSSVESSGDHLPYKYKDAPPPNWDTIQPMTGSHIPGVDTGARGGMTTFMTSGGLQTISSGMGSFGGGMRGAGGSGLAGDRGGAGELQRTVKQFDANLASQTDTFTQNLSDQTAQVALAGIDRQSQTLLDQTYAGTVDPYYHAGSVGDLTRGVAYDSNGFGVEAGQAGDAGGAGGRAAIGTSGLAPGFTTPLDAQIKANTGWYDYARDWLNYASAVPSAGQSLDYATINAAVGAYNAAAATDSGTPEFNARWQTATDAINTMVTANGWHYAPAATSEPTATPTLATVNVAPTPDELAAAGIAPGKPDPGATYGPLDDLRAIGRTLASGAVEVDRSISHFNGVVNDELVDQGAQDLRDGNQAGFIWNGVKYSFYNTFMPDSVEGAAVNLAGGAVAGKVVGLGLKAAAGLLARGIWSSSADQLAKAGFKSVEEFADAVGAKYQQLYDEGYVQAQQLLNEGELPVPPRISVNTALGRYIDGRVRNQVLQWLDTLGVSEGPEQIIAINRYLRDPGGTGRYVIPDVYVHGGRVNRIYDGTIGNKSWASRQIQGFHRYSGGADISVTKPTELGGTRHIGPDVPAERR